ncbi:MAG: hypothetical protein V1875_02970 [Candidatus Altiarchaeota archaeon]
MVSRSLRTRSRKKVKLVTPGGRKVTHFKAEKAGRATCGRCGTQMSGVATGSATKMSNLTGSQKVPERPYGGVLCPECLDSLIRYSTRMHVKFSSPEYAAMSIDRDLTLEKYLPRGFWSQVTSGKLKVKSAKSKPKKKSKKEPKAASKPKKKFKEKAKSKKAK